MTGQSPPGALRVATAGIAVVGVAFGMARYGFGLLLPDIRATYALGSGALGLIAATSYLAYIAASAAAALLVGRLGPRVVVVVGGVMATAGMLLAGLTGSALGLVLGVLVAGTSAGLVFPPFSDVVDDVVAPERRRRTLAAISSGTGYGVVVAAPVAVIAGREWRAAWLAFAVCAAAATAWAAFVLPRRAAASSTTTAAVRLRWAWFVCPRSRPLLVGGLVIGLAASLYWTFAVDFLHASGAVSTAGARGLLAVVGVASIVGTLAGDLVQRLGAATTFRLVILGQAGSLALLAAAPGSLALAAASAVLFGASYNLVVAVQGIWSAAVFAERPSAGLAAVMVCLSVGLLVGPPLAGLVADRTGFEAVFLAAGVLLVGTVPLAPRERLDRPPRALPQADAAV